MKDAAMYRFLVAAVALLLAGCATLGDSEFRDYWVSVEGSDSTGNGSQANPWRTITYSLDHADYSGKEVRLNVMPGTYDEKLIIMKSVFILGAGADQVRLENNVSSDEVVDVYGTEPGLSVRLEGVTVDGNDSQNGGIKVLNAVFKLRKATVRRPRFCGIWIEDSPLFAIAESTVTTAGMVYTDYGINIVNSSGVIRKFTGGDYIDHVINIGIGEIAADIIDSEITGSPISWADGIRIQSPANVTIRNTRITRPLDGEPAPADGSHNRPYAGIEIAGSADWGKTVKIRDTQISGFNTGIGINLFGNTVLVRNTRISNAAFSEVETFWSGGQHPHPVVDFGSSNEETGNNTFNVSQPYSFYHRGPYDVQARHNDWDVPANLVHVLIYDQMDDPNLGRVWFE
jgi:hypothetical protein